RLRRTVSSSGPRAGLALAPRGREALGCRLALAGDVPAAVLGLGRGALTLEGLAPVTAGALRGALLVALARAGAPWLSHCRYSNAFRLPSPPARCRRRRA